MTAYVERLKRPCAHCGAIVELERWRAGVKNTFCNKQCRSNWLSSDKNPLRKNKDKICENCGCIFDMRAKRCGEGQRFCSQKCFGEWSKKTNVHVTHCITKTCMHCGKQYEVHPYRKDSEFCSVTCYDGYRREHVPCLTCGKIFIAPKYQKRKYCSAECAKSKQIRVSSGEKEIMTFLITQGIEFTSNTPIHHSNGFYKPDILVGNKIIEFYGTYWHCHHSLFEDTDMNFSIGLTAFEKREHDRNRLEDLKELGYSTLVVWEHDWADRQNEMKQLILTYLREL